MIRYHGTPITPVEAAARCLRGRHAFVSHIAPQSLSVVLDVCQSFAVDNGAFTIWTQGGTPEWPRYYAWVEKIARYPHLDFAVIPDVIDGDEAANDRLVDEWPHGDIGAPVWHLHESLDRLRRLAGTWRMICLGSSGAYANPNHHNWWVRMEQVMDALTDPDGFLLTKVHGLRMLNPEIFGRIPLTSADSTNVAQSMGGVWRGQYEPATKGSKGLVLAERIELATAAYKWDGSTQTDLFGSAVEGGL